MQNCYCRHMGALCHLQLSAVDVSLEALACSRPQLRSLLLWSCHLHASSSPTSYFACGLSKLEVLDLSHSDIDAEIGPVNLPSLASLDAGGLKLVSSQNEPELYDCAGIFSGGCPQCTTLTFKPGKQRPIDDGRVRAGFPKLKAATLDLSSGEYSVEEGQDWPLHPALVSLPLSVTTLECTGEMLEEPLDLHAILAIAAGNIRDGVGLKTLCTAYCTTYVQDGVFDIGPVEPSEQQIAAVYMPVGRTLHGLVRLEIADSKCSQPVLNAVVAAAPDLRTFEIGWCPFYDLVYTLRSTRRIQCSALEELTARIDLHGRGGHEQAALTVQLEDSSRLRTCCIGLGNVRSDNNELRVGDRFSLALECHEGGTVRSSVCWCDLASSKGQGQWHLRCLLQDTPDTGSSSREKGQVTVSYEWGAEQAWITSIHRPA